MDFPGFSLDISALQSDGGPNPDAIYDVLVIGGGPAAMTAAVYAARKMLKLALLTKDFGGQVMDTSDIENYMGFQTITGEELAKKFQEQIRHFEVPFRKDDGVLSVTQDGDLFLVRTENDVVFRGKTVILATGKRSRPLNVPGEREFTGKGVAYCATCDAPFYAGKDVVVAGGANSALTAAMDLLKAQATHVTLVNFIEGWQADEVLMASVRDDQRLNLLDFHEVVRIEGKDRVEAVRVRNRKTGEETVIRTNGIFVEIGLLPNSEPVAELAQVNDVREVLVDCHCATNVPGLFAAGDVTTVPYKQIVISAGEGAKAALAAYDYLAQKGNL